MTDSVSLIGLGNEVAVVVAVESYQPSSLDVTQPHSKMPATKPKLLSHPGSQNLDSLNINLTPYAVHPNPKHQVLKIEILEFRCGLETQESPWAKGYSVSRRRLVILMRT